MIHIQEPYSYEPRTFGLSIEAMEIVSNKHDVRFVISYKGIGGAVSKYTRKWRITVMGKDFIDEDFIQAVREAVKFVMNAHGHTLKDGEVK